MEKRDCISLLESRKSRHDSFQAASLWRVTFVPALCLLAFNFPQTILGR